MQVLQPMDYAAQHVALGAAVAKHRGKHPVLRYHEFNHFDVSPVAPFAHNSRSKG